MGRFADRTEKVLGGAVKGLLDWIGLGDMFSQMLKEDRGFSDADLQKIRNAITKKVANDDLKLSKLDDYLMKIDNPLIQGIGAEALSKAKQAISKARDKTYVENRATEAKLDNEMQNLEREAGTWATESINRANKAKKNIETIIGGVL